MRKSKPGLIPVLLLFVQAQILRLLTLLLAVYGVVLHLQLLQLMPLA